MSYEVSYIDGLQGTWIAQPMPTPTAPIAPYSTGRDGGFAYQAPRTYQPPVGSPTAVLDRALDSETYVTPTGARAWKPTAGESALVDEVTANPYSGVDEFLEAGPRGASGQGFKNLPYVGDVIGGAVEGAAVYGRTGSTTHGVFAGAGSSIGGVAGTAVGASIGAVGGPVGVAVGGLVGGAVGSAFGSAAGQALANLISPLPPANTTGATEITGTRDWVPTDGGDFSRYGGVTIRHKAGNAPGNYTFTGKSYSIVGKTIGGDQYFDVKGPACNGFPLESNIFTPDYYGGFDGRGTIEVIATGVCSQGDPYNKDDFKQPVTTPYKPPISTPRIPRVPGFKLPRPIPRIRPNPTSRPTENPTTGPKTGPTGAPFGMPKPITGIPTLPKITAPGDYPNPGPHTDPYPTGDPTNPNPTEQPSPDQGPCDPCVELRAIKTQLEATFSLAWSLPDCGVNFPIVRSGAIEGQGLAGLSQKIDGLYQVLKVLHDNTRCGNDGIVMPESWNLKKSIEVPQMIIVTKLVGDENPTYRRSFTIPHPRYLQLKDISRIKRFKYKRGSCQATIQLPDNSKGIINASTPAEAKRVCKYVLQLMDQEWARQAEIKVTEKINLEIIPAVVEFHVAKYFKTSDSSLLPVWSQQIP